MLNKLVINGDSLQGRFPAGYNNVVGAEG